MYGPIHLNVSRVDAHRAFWIDTLGAAGGAKDPAIAVFPNVSIVMNHCAPTGGTKGTPVNHIAFAVPDIRAAVDRTRAAGYPIVTARSFPSGSRCRTILVSYRRSRRRWRSRWVPTM